MKRLTLQKASKLRLMLYGKPGSGKTTLCGSAGLDARTAPVLHIDMGGNPEVLAKLQGQPHIYPLQPDKLEELNDIYTWLAGGQPLGTHLSKKYDIDQQVQTVVFDGFTDIQRQSFDAIMGGPDKPFIAAYPKREFSHYYFVLQQMLHMVALLRKLDLHVIVTALEHSKTLYGVAGDQSTIYTYFAPLLDGEAKREVPGYALTVMRLQPSTVDRVLAKQLSAKYVIASTEQTKYQYGKDQMGLGSTEFGDPTITKLLDSIK